MKTFAAAVLGLAVIIVAIFFFASKEKGESDILIPSPIPFTNPSPELTIKGEATRQAVNLPFPILKKEEIANQKIRIKTNKGDILIELFADSPIASSNFIYLVGKNFYDGLTFHRREQNFVIQGGDPKGDGTGGPEYTFPDEPVTREYKQGTVAMANAGPNTNGSQFFILLVDAPNLPKQYTIFGNVSEGMEVVDQIQVGDVMEEVTIE